jgi:ribose 5-phosphate isomerase A
MSEDAAKRAAGEAAAALVETGMLVGLGTGSTARYVVAALGRRVRDERLKITGVPTSAATEKQARELGIPTIEPGPDAIDLDIDGADEIEIGTLRLIKGLGGALLREKIVRQASSRFVVIGDTSKPVHVLGERAPLPVEIIRFGQASTIHRIATLGGAPKLRLKSDATPFLTDSANVIVDCAGFAPIRDPFTLQRELLAIAGVVETGLFLTGVEQAVLGADDGSVSVMRPSA